MDRWEKVFLQGTKQVQIQGNYQAASTPKFFQYSLLLSQGTPAKVNSLGVSGKYGHYITQNASQTAADVIMAFCWLCQVALDPELLYAGTITWKVNQPQLKRPLK